MSQFTIRTMQKDLEALLLQEQKGAAPSLVISVPQKPASAQPAPVEPPEKLPIVAPKLPEIPKEAPRPPQPTPLQPLPQKPILPQPLLPRPPQPPKKENEAEILSKQGWLLYNQKSYLEALEKFEKAAALPISWWTKSKIKKAIGVCRKQIAGTEKERQEKQKKLERQLKAELEEKIKKEREAVEQAKREAAEKARLEVKERAAEEKIKREAEEKAKQEAEKLAKREKKETEEKIRLEEIRRKKRERKPIKISFFEIAIPALVILILLSSIIYWVNYKKARQPALEQIIPPPPKAELIPPAALFYVESTEIIALKAGQESDLPNLLEEIAKQEQQPGIFKRILVKQFNGNEKFLSLSELSSALKINLPKNLSEKINNNYMFFLYGQKEVSSNPFYAGLGKNRFGLAIKTVNPEEIRKTMTDWEERMADDLSPLFFNMAVSSTKKFQNDIYENFTIRYLHSPDKYSSINYALLENYLLIGFSQESTYAAIDRLLK